MDNLLVFTLEKENKPKSTQIIPLDIDLATQPDQVLQIEVSDDEIHFHTTDKTSRILNSLVNGLSSSYSGSPFLYHLHF